MANQRPKGPYLPDLSWWATAGIDPKTGLPVGASEKDFKLKTDTKIQLRVKDEQDAVNRYTWGNIPMNLSSQEIERMLYYKHDLIFFYMKDLDEFFLLPYAMDTGLDFYGRPMYAHPVPYASGTTEDEKKSVAIQAEYLRNIKLKIIYDVQLEEDFYDENGVFDVEKAKKLVENSCVIIRDYTPQLNTNNGIPRATLQDSILEVMSDCIPFSRTALLNSTGVVGVGTNSSDEDAAVYGFSNTINNAALAGKKLIPIRKTSGLEFQELTGGQTAKTDEFLQMMQGYNNFRLSLYGLDNNGLYDKKAYVNNMQSGVSNVGLSLQDGLTQRQHSCNIINSIWGIWLWSDISETVSGMDRNMDGDTYEDEDQSGQFNGNQTQPQEATSND